MDARSSLSLEAVNTAINTKKQYILNLSPSLDGESFQATEARHHRESSHLFFHCLMSAYGHLLALEMLNKKEEGHDHEKYSSFVKVSTHELASLWEKISTPIEQSRKSAKLSQLAEHYRKVVNEIKSELYKSFRLSDELLEGHISGINIGLIKMLLTFTGANEKPSWNYTRRLLSIATAYEFIIQLEYELRLGVLKKTEYLAKETTKFELLRQTFTDDQDAPLSREPLRLDLKKMIDAMDKDAFDDIFSLFKDHCKSYAVVIETPSNQGAEAEPTGRYAITQDAPIDTSMSAVMDERPDSRVDIQRNMQGHVDKSSDELRKKLTQKLGRRLVDLKEKYLGENGEFAQIDALMEALENNDVLPVRQDSLHLAYLQAIDPALMPPRLLKKDTEERLDDDIAVTLQQLTAAKTASEPLEGSGSEALSLDQPDHSPSVEASGSESESDSSSRSINLDLGLPSVNIHSNSHSKSEESSEEPVRKVKRPQPDRSKQAGIHHASSSSLLSVSSSGSTSEEVFDAPEKPISRKRSASYTPVYHRQADGIKSTPTSVNFMRPSPHVMLKPSITKTILISLGIGLAVSAGIALGVGLGFLFIHGAGPVLIGAFLGATKLLGGSTIGAWSAASALLSFPPIASLFIGIKRWQRQSRALEASSGAVVTKHKSMTAPGSGATNKVGSPYKIQSEPLPDGVRMRASSPSPFRKMPMGKPLTTTPFLFGENKQPVSPEPLKREQKALRS